LNPTLARAVLRHKVRRHPSSNNVSSNSSNPRNNNSNLSNPSNNRTGFKETREDRRLNSSSKITEVSNNSRWVVDKGTQCRLQT
jgi:hypothetical protein